MKPAPLPADGVAQRDLTRKVASLEVRPVAGKSASPVAAAVSGKRFTFPSNDRSIESVAFEFGDVPARLAVKTAQGESLILCGSGAWVNGRSAFANGLEGRLLDRTEHPVAASGAWTAEDTYTVKLCLPESPFYINLVFRFDGDRVLFDSEYHVAFGPTTLPQLTGTAQ